jgi:hypothetical protein
MYMSELFTCISGIGGTEMVRREGIFVDVEPDRLRKNDDGLPLSVALRLGELIRLHLDPEDIHIEEQE